jgi:hypothetical protein
MHTVVILTCGFALLNILARTPYQQFSILSVSLRSVEPQPLV